MAGPAFYVTVWYNLLVLAVRWIQFGDTLRGFQALLAHLDFLVCIKCLQIYTGFRNWLLGAWYRAGDSIGLGPKLTKGIIIRTPINNFEVGCHLGSFVFGSQSLDFWVFILMFPKLWTPGPNLQAMWHCLSVCWKNRGLLIYTIFVVPVCC